MGEIGEDRAIEVLRNLRYILSGERRDWDVIYRAEDFLRAEDVLFRYTSPKREDVTKTKSQWIGYLSRRTNLWVDLLFNEDNEIPIRRLAAGAFHLLVNTLSDPDEIVRKQALKAAKELAYNKLTFHGTVNGIEALEKHYGLYQCDVELTKFLRYLLNNFPFEKEWTMVKEVDMEGEEIHFSFFDMVNHLLHIETKPVSQWRLNWLDLQKHLYIRKSDRSLFLEKEYDTESYIAERFPYPATARPK